jgi:tetratricopeptide (TPR) repeat protein
MGRKDKPVAEHGETLSLGMVLRQARQAGGLSLTTMAQRLQMTKGHLSGVENDRVRPSLKLLEHYEQLLELQPGELSAKERQPLNPAHFLAIWNVPFARNPFFIGREDLLTRLHQQFRQRTILSQKQAICGLGGIGKTQLAVEYAYRFCAEYQAVLWVQADSVQTLHAGYHELAQLLQLPEREAPAAAAAQAVKRWLQTRQNWLLILDNADEPELLAPFLPPLMGGQVLLTTRAAALRSFGIAHPLVGDIFPPDTGALFLLRRAGLLAPDAPLSQARAHEREQARQITRELGGLPLALAQAGAYIEATGTSLDQYQRIYQEHRAEVLRERRGVEGDHPEPVATTWALSIQRVEEKNPVAADLLRLCAFLAPEAIGEEIIIKDLETVGPTPGALAADAYLLDQAVETLRASSLLTRDPQAHTLSIHRLVQAVVRDAFAEDTRTQWIQRVVRALAALFPPGTYEHWPQCERLVPHALLCASWIEAQQITTPEAATLLHRTAQYQHARGRYAEVERLYMLALTIRKRFQEDPELADNLMHLGDFFSSQGRYEQAIHHCAQALAIRTLVLGAEHPATARNRQNLANHFCRQGKYHQALPLYEQALASIQRSLGAEHPATVQCVDDLAGLYAHQGKYVQAQSLYEQALAIRERMPGPEHPATADSLHHLAGLSVRQGKYALAEPLLQRALALRERVLGPEHPDTAQSLHSLAELYVRLGKHTQAWPLHQQVLALRERVLGPEHPDIAQSLHSLAGLSAHLGNDDEAETLYQRALALRERVLGPEHPDIAQSLHSLAGLSARLGQHTRAELLHQRALAIDERVLGPEHPTTRRSRQRALTLAQRKE